MKLECIIERTNARMHESVNTRKRECENARMHENANTRKRERVVEMN